MDDGRATVTAVRCSRRRFGLGLGPGTLGRRFVKEPRGELGVKIEVFSMRNLENMMIRTRAEYPSEALILFPLHVKDGLSSPCC